MMKIDFLNSRYGSDVAMALLAANGIDVNTAMPTQGYVRSEVAISSSVTQYKLGVLVNQLFTSQLFPSEQRLQLQDVLVPTEMGVFVAVPSSATAPATKLYSYENLAAFSTSGAPAALLNLWAGQFKLTVDNRQVLPAWDLWRHYQAQRTQQATNTGYATSGVNLVDSIDGSSDGFFPIAPSFLLNGGANIDATINLPAAISTVQTNSRIVVIWRGILCQNVTNVR